MGVEVHQRSDSALGTATTPARISAVERYPSDTVSNLPFEHVSLELQLFEHVFE